MLIQSASIRSGLMRDTVVLLENFITVPITKQHKRMEVIIEQLYVPNCNEVGTKIRNSAMKKHPIP